MSELDLVGTGEAAAMLDVSTKTITRWAASGRLVPATKAPGATGALLFRRTAVTGLAEALADEAEARAADLRDVAAS